MGWGHYRKASIEMMVTSTRSETKNIRRHCYSATPSDVRRAGNTATLLFLISSASSRGKVTQFYTAIIVSTVIVIMVRFVPHSYKKDFGACSNSGVVANPSMKAGQHVGKLT